MNPTPIPIPIPTPQPSLPSRLVYNKYIMICVGRSRPRPRPLVNV